MGDEPDWGGVKEEVKEEEQEAEEEEQEAEEQEHDLREPPPDWPAARALAH